MARVLITRECDRAMRAQSVIDGGSGGWEVDEANSEFVWVDLDDDILTILCGRFPKDSISAAIIKLIHGE